MNIYKTALSALILAPIVGGISVHMIQNYMEMKEKAETLSAYSAEQVNRLEAMLADETILNEAVPDAAESDALTEGIAGAVLRFHVRANSDSEEDQALKFLVRDGILKEMAPLLEETASKAEAEQIIGDHLQDIERIAEAIIQEAGYDYPVRAYLTEEEFPIKEYGDMRFPNGTYQALRVDIGEHEGANWWCVMYPGLCFVETAGGVVATEGKEELKQILTPEEYAQILVSPPENAEIEYKSLLWEKWQQLTGD